VLFHPDGVGRGDIKIYTDTSYNASSPAVLMSPPLISSHTSGLAIDLNASVVFYNKLYYFTTPHQHGKKEKPSVFLSGQFSASLKNK
jgi:hypothetical protein